MAQLRLSGITKSYDGRPILAPIDLTVGSGELIVLVGPSGCGKSTTLRIIAGLEEPSGGELFIDERRVTHLPPAERDIAMVFQSYALYPHMSVYDNLAFALRMRKTERSELDRRVRQAARALGIEELLERFPKQLSGGQRQRVAIGRAVVRDPKVFLFDEPLSNLDAQLRAEMRREIARIHARTGATSVYVTHDQTEAMTLGDRIVVLRDGKVMQIGTPLELYDTPQNRFVAGFLGAPRMSFLRGVPGYGDDTIVGIRPEDLALAPRAGAPALETRVIGRELVGAEAYLHLESSAGPLVARTEARTAMEMGAGVRVWLAPERLHLFDAVTDERR